MAGIHASGWIVISFILSVVLFGRLRTQESIETELFTWFSVGNLNIPFAFLVDHLSIIMMMVITGVGGLIHIYSIGYMHGDEGFNRFFAYLNLFVFFMLMLVMADNYVLMFVGWEGVGLCSYLLIGFWFKNQDYNKAANKAFIMNRIGDLAMLIGLFMLFQYFGSLRYEEVFSTAATWVPDTQTITIITLLLFIGACGKSAQIPLYTWLPDAMAGPTPVSALIHAATMVTAGIYMIVRSNVLYALAPFTLDIVMVVGLATAIFAATIGLKQNDIKKVLAYSTVSQLGLMFFALGLGAYQAGFFHLITHAFFKALLFLAAGSVIHGLSGEQDIRKMGGIRNKMKITHAVFLIGTLAIAALPPFSGFFSKDSILLAAYERSPLLWALGMGASLVTVFYMFRLYFVVFYGEGRMTDHVKSHIHESPGVITFPLIALGVLAIIGGAINLPHLIHGNTALDHFLENILHLPETEANAATEIGLIVTSVILILAVIFIVRNKYISKQQVPETDAELKGFGKILNAKYYVDELYDNMIAKPLHRLSTAFSKNIESLIDGIVDGSGVLLNYFSGQMKVIQNGYIGYYLFAMALGVGGILILILM